MKCLNLCIPFRNLQHDFYITTSFFNYEGLNVWFKRLIGTNDNFLWVDVRECIIKDWKLRNFLNMSLRNDRDNQRKLIIVKCHLHTPSRRIFSIHILCYVLLPTLTVRITHAYDTCTYIAAYIMYFLPTKIIHIVHVTYAYIRIVYIRDGNTRMWTIRVWISCRYRLT